MRSHTNNFGGVGNGPDSDHLKRMHQRLEEMQPFDSETIAWEQTTRGLRAHIVNPTVNGKKGWAWQSPKELDPTVSVSSGTFVYVSPLNTLVTTGLIDLILGVTTTCRPGIWQAVQSVPPKTSLGKYNMPQVPLPGSGGVPTGSPLKGDADGPNVFWILWAPTVYC